MKNTTKIKLLKENEAQLRMSESALKLSELKRCPLSYQVGYFQGRVDLIKSIQDYDKESK